MKSGGEPWTPGEMALKRTSLDGNGLRMEVLWSGSEWRDLASSSRVRSAMECSRSFDSVWGELPSPGASQVLF